MNEGNKNRQMKLIYIFVSLVLIAFAGLVWSTFKEYWDGSQNKKVYVRSADLPMDGIDPQEIWVEQIKSQNEIVQEKVDYMQDLIVDRLKEDDKRDVSKMREIADLRKEIDALRLDMKKGQIVPNNIISEKELFRGQLKNAVNSQQETWDPFGANTPILDAPLLEESVNPLTSVVCNEPKNLRHVNRSIPAGTTVKAILLSSVDMPCGVRGSTDPLPVKLRMIADGHLPHEVRARLKGGIVTASVYGDLSSERVYFRLEKLTQVRADGHYIETQVAGYVSGEDGKYGMRGIVVDKSSQLVENALMSGFLSGASSFFEAAASSRLFPVGPLGGCCDGEGCQTPSWGQTAGQLGIAGGSGGFSNALDVLTDYYIKRAEQIRPVIEITPGRIVDITFLESADLGDIHTHERVRNSGNRREECGS